MSGNQGSSYNERSTREPKLTQDQYNKSMCVLSKHTDQTEEKDHPIKVPNKWLLDSGASDHICCDISLFSKYNTIPNALNSVIILDGSRITVKYVGIVVLQNGLQLITSYMCLTSTTI